MVRKLTITESINLDDYTYKFTKQGYKLYSKMVNNKAQWVAVGEDGIPFEVSYEAVRGFEPINPADAKLQKKVAKALKMESNEAEYNKRCKELGICENTEHKYRVWYRPYGLDGDEEDYIDVTASDEEEARRFARTCGHATDVELLESGPYTPEETGSYTARDAKEAAKQVFDNAYSLYNKTGAAISEFQMDVELDTNKFWDTLASLCSDNGFEYVIVSEDENFDDKYYTIKLMDVEEVDECIYESITIGDTTYSDEDIEDAVAYAYGLLPQKAHEEVLRGTYSDKEIRKAIIYWELRDLPYRIRQTEFRKRCREANLESLGKGYSVQNECITEDIEDFDQYVGCEATFDGDLDDIKFFFTNKEFKEIQDYIGSDGSIIDLGGPNDCCGVIRFNDGATFTIPFDYLEIHEQMTESTYTDLGYRNRESYLKSLADDYGVDINTVKELAYALGPEEDFDALVSEIEDFADDYKKDEKDPLQYYLDTYDYVVCSADNTYKNYDFIFPYDTYKFAKLELARDLVTYKTETCLFDKGRKTKTNYSPDKLDVSKLNPGGHGWVEEDEDYINPEKVGDAVAQQNIDSILRMCRVGTEKY